MQNSQVWTSSYPESASGQQTSPTVRPAKLVLGNATPPSSLRQMSLSSQGSQPDIWAPLHTGRSMSSSLAGSTSHGGAARGSSFGAYGALTSLSSASQRTSASNSFDSERFRSGGVAWGSAELPRRRLASFPSAEPGSTGSPGSTPERESFLASLSPMAPPETQLDFTGPAISILERFSNLGDATKRAELAGRPEAPHTPQMSPEVSQAKIWSPETGAVHIHGVPGVQLSQAAGGVPVPVPVPIPLSHAGPHTGSVPTSHAGSLPPSIAGAHASPQPGALGTFGPQIPLGQPAFRPGSAPRSSPSQSRRKKRSDSPFLERLRSSGPSSVQLTDLFGNILDASTDQHGSRFIQERLGAAPQSVKHQFLAEVLPSALALATDVFGNYVVQLLFEVCDPADRKELWTAMRGNVLPLTLQMYGCRVVQMALRYLDRGTQQQVVAELQDHVLRCIRDHNGNHVVQKAVEFVPAEDIAFIYEGMLSQALPLSKHMYGCRVVQRALEHGSSETRTVLLATVRNNIDALVLDQYGNYVVQHVVEHGPTADREVVLDHLIAEVVALSGHKYASNVIEKCFIKSNPQQRSAMVSAIVNATDKDGDPAVLGMMKDQYANYVIQRILGTARNDDYDRLARAVKKNLPIVKRTYHGKHLQAIERRLRP